MDVYSFADPKKAPLKKLSPAKNSRKKKIRLFFLFIWLLSLAVFVLMIIIRPQMSSGLKRIASSSFVIVVSFLPVLGFMFGNRLIKIITLIVLTPIAFYVLVNMFIMRPNKIIGHAMLPSLRSGDYVFSELISYRYGSPKRGDVVVFNLPESPSDEFISRVIGLPGEFISIKSGKVYINNELLDEPYLGTGVTTEPGPYIHERNILIPNGQYVVMGDNRGSSNDSRSFGFVEKPSIYKKVFYVFWPANNAGFVRHEAYKFDKSDGNFTDSMDLGNVPAEPLTSCHTLGTLMVRGSDGKGEIGCDIKVDGEIDLSKSFCESQTTRMRQLLIPDAYGRSDQYYATLSGLDFDEKVKVYVYSPDGTFLECTPILNND